MAIFREDDDSVIDNTSTVQTSHSFVTREELKTSLVFNKEEPIETIANYINGMSWSVDYFLQIKNINDVANKPDVNKSAAIQKYNRINNLELILQSAINQDDFENIQGEAIINAGFTPCLYDAFKAKLIGGREAIFVIETLDKRNYNLRETYFVTFKLFATIDEEAIVYNDLVLKTIKEYVYDKNYLLDYGAPVILASDFKNKLNLKKELDTLINYYLKVFVNNDINVLALPTTTGTYVDTFLINFINRIIDVTKYPNFLKLSSLDNTSNLGVNYTIWDAIINRDKSLLPLCSKDIDFKFTPNTSSYAISRHLSFLGVNYIVGRTDTELTLPLLDIKIDTDKDLTVMVSSNPNNKFSYVFSENFYSEKNIDKLGTIENLVLDFLDGKILDTNEISKCINEFKHWETLEQFYLIPVLIVLIKDSINNTFVSI